MLRAHVVEIHIDRSGAELAKVQWGSGVGRGGAWSNSSSLLLSGGGTVGEDGSGDGGGQIVCYTIIHIPADMLITQNWRGNS
jgi:hypothetical protein